MKSKTRRRLAALTVFGAFLLLAFFYPRPSSTANSATAQNRRPRQQTRRPSAARPQTEKRTTAAVAQGKYSRFKHEDHRAPVARLDCNDCHTIPTPAAPDRVAAATKPAAYGYPYHDSCVRCHRQQFFKGASPGICTVCHTRATPRTTARDMLPFPKKSDQLMAREFPGYFPHSLHQNIIARHNAPARDVEARVSFVRTAFIKPDETAAKFVDNCATCHSTDEREPEAIRVGGTEGTFKPETKGTFKTVPDGHASCFNCHWQAEKPTKDDCADCHLSPSEFAKKKRAASVDAALPGVISPRAAEWFKGWPREWPKRLSIKFRHATTSHDIGCTTCHINLTRMETLNIPKADVPIATCAPCHISTSPVLRKDGKNVTLFTEMSEEAKDKENKTNTCTGCHTSLVGQERPPCSHYLVLGQKCQQ